MRQIVGYEGLYSVSDKGEVYSDPRLDRLGRKRGGNIVKQRRTKNGYMQVLLYRGGVRNTRLVHRVVMEAYRGASSLCVDHLNGDKTDNRLENLQYVTHRENSRRHFSYRDLPVGVHRVGGKYRALKSFKTTAYNLGVYDSIAEAEKVYLTTTENQARQIHDLLTRRGKYAGVNQTRSGRWWGKYQRDGRQYCTPRVDSREECLYLLNKLKEENGHD